MDRIILVYVKFSDFSREYVYQTTDDTLAPGDRVIVPQGAFNREKLAVVVRTEVLTEETRLPCPLSRIKKVLRKDPENVRSAGAEEQMPKVGPGRSFGTESAQKPGSDDPFSFLPEQDPEIRFDLPDTTYRKQISDWTDEDSSRCIAEPKDHELYRQLVYHGVRKGWPEALEALGYGSYGGNNVFSENWEASEACFLKLIEILQDPSPFYYNTLGYIYYYGRTNGGVPLYEKAYQYFSIAAIHGVFEAMYKTADMLVDGRGVPKNVEAALIMVRRVYENTRDQLEEERFECKFADAALRLGSMFETGKGVPVNPENAYSLYLQARFAIRERMKVVDYYGDSKVEQNIEEAVKRMERKLPDDYFRKNIFGESPYMIGTLLANSEAGIDLGLIEKDGVSYLAARLFDADQDDDETPRKHLFVLPELKFCALTDSVVMRIEEPEDIQIYYRDRHAYVNHIEYDKETGIWNFCYLNYPMLQIKCKGYSFEV